MRTQEEFYTLFERANVYILASGIDTMYRGVAISFSKRMKRTLATTTKHSNGEYTITFSERLLEADENSCYNIIIHEILHTCPDCMKHTGEWRKLANVINNKYPQFDIQRFVDIKSLVLCTPPAYKYAFKCKDCGKIVKRRIKSNFVKNYQDYRCGNCHGDFTPISI